MGSSSASSSQPSARVPSPSPSPRSMRFGSSRHNSLVQQPSSASSSFLPLPPAANGIRIPHSQADLDRLHMERQLGELSMMSSSRASSSFLSRSSNHPDDDGRSQTASHPSQDDFGSSVEFARAPSPGGNLSAQGAAGQAAGSSFGQSSFNTTHTAHQHAPSPVSTNGHHASAITLRTGLVGSGLPAFRGQQGGSGGFDDDRELGKMLGGSNPQQRAFSFGLSDLGFPSGGKAEAPIPRPTKSKKLTDALARSFSPARHSVRVPSPLAAGGHPSRGQRSATEESLFTTLARGVEDQLRSPLQSHPSPSQVDASGHLRRSSSAGNNGTKKKRDVSAQLGRRASQNRSRAVSGGGIGQTSIYLPDVTGLTEAVGEMPLRAAPRQTTLHEGREDPHPYPLQELQTLQSRLQSLETENSQSRRRIGQLEDELRLTREREAAAKEEWILEREVLQNRRRGEEGMWEKRYYEVLEEKKVLEELVATLRSQVMKLQADLKAQQGVIGQLQAQRQADQAELARRGEEVDRLRDEVRALSAEVGGLRQAFEGSQRERREVQVQTSPREREERPRSSQGLGLDVRDVRADLSVLREEGEDRDSQRERHEARREDERRRSARSSPVERPASRLSDGLRMAAAPHNSPPLPSSPRMADVLPPPSPRHRSRFATAASASRPNAQPHSPNAWAASFEQEEPVLDLDEHTEEIAQEDLVDLRDEAVDDTIRPVSPPAAPRARTRTRSGGPAVQEKGKARERQASGGIDNRLPPQTVLSRVLRELEDEYSHYKAIYSELADQYKILDAASNVAKRNVLAEHLREVIDTLEQKGDQIASLYSLLTFADRPLPEASPAAMSAKEQLAFKSVKDLLRSVKENDLGKR